MSESAPSSAYSIGANLRWFALINAGVMLAICALAFVASLYNFNLPSTGLNIGGFFASVYAAGYRFAQKREWDWDAAERRSLAFGYVWVSTLVSLVLVGALGALFVLNDRTSLAVVAPDLVKVGAILAAILVLMLLLYYGAALFALHQISKRVPTGAPT